MTGWMEGATGVQTANFLMKIAGEGRIEAVAVMTTGTIMEEVGRMITVEMIETTTVIVMIIAEMTTAEVVETVTDAATEIEVGAAMVPEAGAVG